MTKTLAATTTADRERAALEQALLAEEQALLDGTLSAEELMADEDTTVTLSSKGAAKKKAKAAAADDEEDMDDVPMPDDQSYDDGEDGADSEPDGDVDDEEDTHGPVTTPKKGHTHGKYGLHTHADDADHSDAPLAEDDSAQMSETPARRTASPAASYELGELSALLSEDDDESVTLDDVRAMKAALRQLAEERVALREQQYREEVTRLSEGFVREMRLPTVGGVKGGKATLAPSRVFRGRFERFMLSDTMRGASDEDRNQFLQLLHTAYLHGAVPVTQLSEKAPAEGDPTPPAQLGSRADRPAASSANSASKHAEGTAPSRLILLAEAKAKAEHNKTLSELTQAQRSVIYAAAARDVNYQGAER